MPSPKPTLAEAVVRLVQGLRDGTIPTDPDAKDERPLPVSPWRCWVGFSVVFASVLLVIELALYEICSTVITRLVIKPAILLMVCAFLLPLLLIVLAMAFHEASAAIIRKHEASRDKTDPRSGESARPESRDSRHSDVQRSKSLSSVNRQETHG